MPPRDRSRPGALDRRLAALAALGVPLGAMGNALAATSSLRVASSSPSREERSEGVGDGVNARDQRCRHRIAPGILSSLPLSNPMTDTSLS